MKKFTFPQFLIFISLVFFSFIGKSQVSITADDFISILVAGNTYVTYMDTTTQQVDIGTSGQNHWDLSDLTTSSEFETESKLVSSSPYSDKFPDADYASNFEGTFSGFLSNSWVYNSIDSDFVMHGSATVADASVGEVETLIKYDPAWVQYTLPVQYGDSVGYTGIQTLKTTTSIPGVGETNNTIEQDITVTQEINGYGIVTYPGGNQYRVLRIVEKTTFNYDGVITSSTIVRLISKTGESVTFTPTDSTDFNGVIEVENVSWTSGSGSGVIDGGIDSPSGLAAVAGDGQIDISWSDNSDSETGFYIERAEDGGSFVVIDSTSADVLSYSDTDVEAGIEYTYRVRAYISEGTSEYSSEINAMIEVVITVDAPSGVNATAGETSIELMWTDNSDNETGFYIERADDDGSFVLVDSTSADVDSYSDTSVSAGIEYKYRVQAYNAEAKSEFSATVNATIVASGIDFQAKSKFQLEQNFPNPFHSSTTIKFNLPGNENVKLNVYNSDGKLVKQLVNSRLNEGEHSVDLSAGELESGTYYYQLETNYLSETRSMVVLR